MAIEKEVNFRFLIHDPACKYVIDRAIDEGKGAQHIVEDCKLHLEHLKAIRTEVSSVGRAKGRIEIRTIKDKMPDCFYLLADDTLFIEPYLQSMTGRDCPIFSLKKNELNEPVFSAFKKAMTYKWGAASEVP